MAINYLNNVSATFHCIRRLCWRLPPASVATSLCGLPLPMPSCCHPWMCCLLLLPPPLPPPTDTGLARYCRPRPKQGSNAVIGDCKWMMPLPTSADASIAATATKGMMSCSLALDYSICIRLLQEKDKLWWELLPLSHWEGPNLGVGTIALRALSDDGAKEEGGIHAAVCCTLSCKCSHSSIGTVDPQHACIEGSSWPIHVKASVKEGNKRGMSGESVCILARVMAQSAASEIVRLSKEGRGGGTHLLVMLPIGKDARSCTLSCPWK